MSTTKTLATRILFVGILAATVPPTASPALAGASSLVISVRLRQVADLDAFNDGVRAGPGAPAGPATPQASSSG